MVGTTPVEKQEDLIDNVLPKSLKGKVVNTVVNGAAEETEKVV